MSTGGKANGDSVTTWTYTPPPPLGMQKYRAPSLLQPHRARDELRDAHDGKIPPLIGFYCGLSCPPVAKMVSQQGFDIVWVDWENASTNVETMTQMVHDIQHISEGKTMAFVRVPGHDHGSIGFALDAGASIVVPQVDTVEQAQQVISAAKFGASIKGKRIRSSLPLSTRIESVEGIKNLDAILTEVGEHIDSVWLGSFDCRVSMGLGGLVGEEPEWLVMKALYESTLAKHNKPASGLAMGPPEVTEIMAKGKSFLVCGTDFYALLGQAQVLETMRENYKQMDYSGVYEKL